MKTITLVLLAIAMTTLCAYPTHAGIRCANDIISIGDTTSEVMMKLGKCGEVLDKEVVRKETVVEINNGEKVKKEIMTENWLIQVKERGGMYCYPLSFEEGRLKRIDNWRKCD